VESKQTEDAASLVAVVVVAVAAGQPGVPAVDYMLLTHWGHQSNHSGEETLRDAAERVAGSWTVGGCHPAAFGEARGAGRIRQACCRSTVGVAA